MLLLESTKNFFLVVNCSQSLQLANKSFQTQTSQILRPTSVLFSHEPAQVQRLHLIVDFLLVETIEYPIIVNSEIFDTLISHR
jgi:hypothetical protein